MKNQKYFPFERNRYYYGKLLTSADFNSEQKYYNDKRRFINRLLFGGGVIAGLNVIKTDDYSITIDAGAALDYSGREIVLDSPVVKRVSAIKGYNPDEQAAKFYVCIGYQEKEEEPVHAVGNVAARAGESTECNKFHEGAAIYLTEEEPEYNTFLIDSLNTVTTTIFDGEGIYITQSVPRVVNAFDEFYIDIAVQKRLQDNPVTFSYGLKTDCITTADGGKIQISFNEKEFAKSTDYRVKIPVIAQNMYSADDSVTVLKDTFRLDIGDREFAAASEHALVTGNISPVRITTGSRIEELEKMFFLASFDEHVKETEKHRIYLARVILAKSGSAYVIDSVERMPFDQYLMSGRFERIIKRVLAEDRSGSGQGKTRAVQSPQPAAGRAEMIQPPERVSATGTVEIYLGLTPRAHQKFFTEEITHGLGDGPVTVVLGCEYDDGMDPRLSKDRQAYFGDQELFLKSPLVPGGASAALGAICYYRRGTFKIGARLLANTGETVLKVRWLAYKDPKANEEAAGAVLTGDPAGTKLVIKPDTVRLSPRETIRFEALIPNNPDAHLIYSIVESDGGTIDANGVYQAPSQEGIYEVRVYHDKEPDVRASALIIVKYNA